MPVSNIGTDELLVFLEGIPGDALELLADKLLMGH
jgi:hypothetical protein